MTIFNELMTLLENEKNLTVLNAKLKATTGIVNFFKSSELLDEFKSFLTTAPSMEAKLKDLGDFQTPLPLTDKICNYLNEIGFVPEILVEPTAGSGTFVLSALNHFPSIKYIYCVELQATYEWLFKIKLFHFFSNNPRRINLEFHRDDIFRHHFSTRFMEFIKNSRKNILILGNPPWITNTELATLDSTNVPPKSNVKGDRGIEALTGKGNFDIAEAVILRMIRQFSNLPGKIAMLCKTSVIRNLVKSLPKTGLKIHNIHSFLIDAPAEFKISASAGLFLADLGKKGAPICFTFRFDEKLSPTGTFGWIKNKFVSNIEKYHLYSHLDGQSSFIWRQGVKHDALRVMVLKVKNGYLINGYEKKVNIEPDLLFPFLKGSNLKRVVIKDTNQQVIIPQTYLNQDTHYIATHFPKLWRYLESYAPILDHRKSRIYRRRPRFSIFGIGDYAFKPYKIAISGFYKTPLFAFIFPINQKPVMLDDTCYYLFFEDFLSAFFTWILLNHDIVSEFLSSIVFLDNKRPYSKEILMRIDFTKVAKSLPFNDLKRFYKDHLELSLPYDFNEVDYKRYIQRLQNKYGRQRTFKKYFEKASPN
ncbi:MAG: hypothetical protein ACTSRS_02435 [Candidatus Helarchaeota archaeon]